jgi:tryptophanase
VNEPVRFRTIIEPFRIKTVEPIRQTTQAERAEALERAHYNVFLLQAEDGGGIALDLPIAEGHDPQSTHRSPTGAP